MMGFLADYEPVEDRIAKFWEDNPDGQINTRLLPAPEGQFIVKASIWRTTALIQLGASDKEELMDLWGRPDATGLAQEVITEKGVNSKSALENCETSAIGRALANLGYAAKGKRPSREEIEKATRDEEPAELTPWRWLWNESAIFKAWSTEERIKAIAIAVNSLAITSGEDMTKDEADRVFTHIKGQYESREEQTELPV